MHLRLLGSSKRKLDDQSILLAEKHHLEIIEAYVQSHRVRNHSEETIKNDVRLLTSWFKNQSATQTPVFVWDAMEPDVGRQMMQQYIKLLVDSELTSKTIRRYLGTLNQFFSFVLEHPFVTVSGEYRRLQEIYGPIEQPLSEFDIPVHVTDTDAGLPLDPERIYDFLSALREEYLKDGSLVKERNYAMAVLAAESGLRIDELTHLEIKRDLFFKSSKLQTRNAKSSHGSGKKTRTTLFSPFAQDTVAYYIAHARPAFVKEIRSDFLFVTNRGKIVTDSSANDALAEMIAAAQRAGFPVSDTLTFHWFRRIFSTRFIERYPDKLHVLIELLGHSNMATVHHYIRHSKAWMDKEIQGVLERFGRI